MGILLPFWRTNSSFSATSEAFWYLRRAKLFGVEFGGSKLEKTLSGFFWIFDKDHIPKFIEFSR